MESGARYPGDDPSRQAIKIRGMLDDVRNHAGEDAGKIDDPGAEALFETTASGRAC